MRADVAVIGIGAMGSAALWRLAARGARVVGFEQFEPGHDQGSSHGETRIIRTAYFEHPAYVPLVRRAFELWRTLERETGAALLTMTGALMMGRRDSAAVTGALASAREHDLAHELLDGTAMRRRYPQHRLDPDDVAVYEDLAGFVRPEAGVTAMVARAASLGATVLRGARVERVEPAGDRVRIVAGDTAVEAGHAIVAAGPWLGAFLPALPVPLQVERQVMCWFPVREPELYRPDRCPVFLREIDGGRFRYGFPTLDGETIKVAIHHEGTTTTPDRIDREIHPRDLEPVQNFVRASLVGVEPVAMRGKVCMYTNTPDEHFVVGSPPDMPRVTVLGGFSGHGYKFAPTIGDVAADFALDGGTAYPIALFSPTRFALR